jgi:hypothetical protein
MTSEFHSLINLIDQISSSIRKRFSDPSLTTKELAEKADVELHIHAFAGVKEALLRAENTLKHSLTKVPLSHSEKFEAWSAMHHALEESTQRLELAAVKLLAYKWAPIYDIAGALLAKKTTQLAILDCKRNPANCSWDFGSSSSS